MSIEAHHSFSVDFNSLTLSLRTTCKLAKLCSSTFSFYCRRVFDAFERLIRDRYQVLRDQLSTIFKKYSKSSLEVRRGSQISTNTSANIRDLLSANVRFRLLVILIMTHTSQRVFASTMRISFLKVMILYKFLSFAEFKCSRRRC